MLAKSCLCPGLVVLITNLIKSSLNNKEIDNLLEEKKDDPNYTWLWEYWDGKKYEIYRIQIPNCYADQAFCEIANNVYKEKSVLLFALEIVVNRRDSDKQKSSGDILLNPGNYKLPKPFSGNTVYTYYGYFIADDMKDAAAVFENDYKNENYKFENELQSLDDDDREMIAAEFHRFAEDEDFNIDVDNIEGGEWFNLQ